MRWGHLLRLNAASLFLGMETLGVLSTSGSSNRQGCDGNAGFRASSEGSVSDWWPADPALDGSAEATLSGAPLKLTSPIWPTLSSVDGGGSLD